MSQIDRYARNISIRVAAPALCGFLALSGSASAQPESTRDHRTAFGHLHVHPSDPAEHREFWIDTLGAAIGHVGTMEVAKFPGGLVEWISPSWGDAKPAGGSKSTSVHHVAFSVPDLRAALDSVTAAGYPDVTSTEMPEGNGKTAVAFVMGPDDLLVELVESKAQRAPYSMDHIHFTTPQAAETEAWYVKLLDATRSTDSRAPSAEIPGTRLVFSPSSNPVTGTKGRVLDHIGFEVRDLEAFTKEIEGMGITVERFIETDILGGLAIAYITDPWGTYIELTDGLDKVQ